MDLLKDWFKRTFSDPQVVLLALLLIGVAMPFGIGQRMLTGLGKNYVTIGLGGLQATLYRLGGSLQGTRQGELFLHRALDLGHLPAVGLQAALQGLELGADVTAGQCIHLVPQLPDFQ